MAAASAQMAASANPPVLLSFPSSTRRSTPRPPARILCGVATAGTDTRRPCWATAEAEIDAHLAASIPTGPPPPVRDPILRLVSSATRTMAPVLCVAACELVGGRREVALGASCALRLVHAAFEAHRSFLGHPSPAGAREPGPADAAMRDGVKLMTADGLLTLGYQLVAEADAGGEPGRVLRVLVEMTAATGPQGIPEGEYEGVRHRQGSWKGGRAEAEDWLERVCKKKEGRFYACAGACGAILGGAGEEETERLRRCGMYVGMLHGFLYGRGSEVFAEASCRETRDALAGELRSLALSELEGFLQADKEAIVGLLDVSLSGISDVRQGELGMGSLSKPQIN